MEQHPRHDGEFEELAPASGRRDDGESAALTPHDGEGVARLAMGVRHGDGSTPHGGAGPGLGSRHDGGPRHKGEAGGLTQRNERGGSPAPYIDVPYFGPDPADGQQTGGLLEYWRILRRRRGTLILFAFLGALVGFLVTLPQTPVYQARTSVEIVGLNENFLNIKQVTPVSESGATSETSDIQTQIKILQSESLLERVLAKVKTKVPEPGGPSRISAWRRALNLPEPPPIDQHEMALRSAARSLKVRAAGQSRILEITVDSTDPRTAAEFANTLATEFIEQNLESRWKSTEHTSDWLTHQLDDMRIKLERSEDAMQAYARQAGLMFTSEKTNVSEEKLKQLQQELSVAQGERIAKQSRFEMATTSPPEALPDVLNDTGLREYQSKLTELRRQIAELSSTFTPDHPKVKRVQAQLSTMETALERERGAIVKRIRNEYDEAVRKEKLLTSAYATQARLVTGESEKAIQYNIMKREVDSNRMLYDTMLQQLKQSTIAAAMRASNIRVVDTAKAPTRPYKPNMPVSSGLGLFTGLFLGVAFVIMRERADRSIQQPGDSPFYLNIPELGIIPSGFSDRASVRVVVRLKPKVVPASAMVEAPSALEQRVELVTWQRKPSMLAESFRSALISILFTGENGSRPKVLVLTSSGPSEGKTTVVSNLGIAIAEVGQKVLLIDADMRKPRMHTIFGMTNEQGLSEVLRQKMTLNGDKTMGGLIRETEIPGLFVLTSGGTTSGATNLLYGAYMPELLRHLREEFETILIDTPPMLQIPDARVLGRMADQVILVVRAGKTTRDAAVAARQRFSEDGTKLLGTILNDWNPKHSPDGYYGYYSGYYRHYGRYYSRTIETP
jgi:polysaccharide biosynthesis transport protein